MISEYNYGDGYYDDARTGSNGSVSSSISEMLSDDDGSLFRNIHILPPNNELKELFGQFPVDQNAVQATGAANAAQLKEQIMRVIGTKNMGGWLFNGDNSSSLNDIPHFKSQGDRLAFASIVASSWMSLQLSDEMRSDHFSALSVDAKFLSNEIQKNSRFMHSNMT